LDRFLHVKFNLQKWGQGEFILWIELNQGGSDITGKALQARYPYAESFFIILSSYSSSLFADNRLVHCFEIAIMIAVLKLISSCGSVS
jgi:hypothetical protein